MKVWDGTAAVADACAKVSCTGLMVTCVVVLGATVRVTEIDFGLFVAPGAVTMMFPL